MIPSKSAATASAGLVSTVVSSTKTKTNKSTPYNSNFSMHLRDHGFHETSRSDRLDLEDLQAALRLPRRDLSPSHFTKEAFETFATNDSEAKDEQDVLANVIPMILGPNQTNRPCGLFLGTWSRLRTVQLRLRSPINTMAQTRAR